MGNRKKSNRPAPGSTRTDHTDDWLAWAIDTLAHEYGWSKAHILEEVYPDELVTLFPIIEKRKLDEYRMQLAIAQNPHVKDPKRLWSILEDKTYERPQTLDVKSFENLKATIGNKSRLVVK